MDYRALSALPTSAYKDPSNFTTEYDSIRPERAEEQYKTGLDYGRKPGAIIFINGQSVWRARYDSAKGPPVLVTSYEGIGYHAHTASLLRGFLDSGASVVVERNDGTKEVISGPETSANFWD